MKRLSEQLHKDLLKPSVWVEDLRRQEWSLDAVVRFEDITEALLLDAYISRTASCSLLNLSELSEHTAQQITMSHE